MISVGILSFSDGRNRVHAELEAYINECAQNIKKSLVPKNLCRFKTAQIFGHK